MKKISFILLLFIGITANAQLEKGAKLVGIQTNLIAGDMYYTNLALDISSFHNEYGLNIVPTFGWALERNWIVGGQATFGFLRSKNNSNGTGISETINTYYDLGIAPFTRAYLDITKNQRWKVFGMGSVEIVSRQSRYTVKNIGAPTSVYNYTSARASIGIGLAYFGRKLAVDLNASSAGLRLGFYKTFTSSKK